MPRRKTFFKRSTENEIKNLDLIDVVSNIIESVAGLGYGQAAVIRSRLVPERYAPMRNLEGKLKYIMQEGLNEKGIKDILNGKSIRQTLASVSKKFITRAYEIKIREFNNLKQSYGSRLTPLDIRRRILDSSEFRNLNFPHPGYSIKPFNSSDQRITRITLVECIEGLLIYGYANSSSNKGNPFISIETKLDDNNYIKTEGATVYVKVPSRNQKQNRVLIKIDHLPVIDNQYKLSIAYRIKTTPNIQHYMKRFTQDNHPEDADFNYLDAYSVAAILGVIDHYRNNEENNVPFEMNQIIIPHQNTIDFYDKLCNQCLIQTPGEREPRKLYLGEKEILLWGLVKKLGHDNTCVPEKGTKIKDYKWHIR